MDHWSQALEVTETLTTKPGKLATEIGVPVLKELVTKAESSSGKGKSINSISSPDGEH